LIPSPRDAAFSPAGVFPGRGGAGFFSEELSMSIQYITIGATPCEEDCAQVGQADYPERSRRECLVFKRLLERMYPVPDGAWLKVKSFAHDFGSYREVCVCYEDQDEAACDYAYRLEEGTPAKWDAIARHELLWLDRKERFSQAAARGEITRDEIPARYRGEDFPVLPADKSFTDLCAMFPL
jgi:hypothetical protein